MSSSPFEKKKKTNQMMQHIIWTAKSDTHMTVQAYTRAHTSYFEEIMLHQISVLDHRPWCCVNETEKWVPVVYMMQGDTQWSVHGCLNPTSVRIEIVQGSSGWEQVAWRDITSTLGATYKSQRSHTLALCLYHSCWCSRYTPVSPSLQAMYCYTWLARAGATAS